MKDVTGFKRPSDYAELDFSKVVVASLRTQQPTDVKPTQSNVVLNIVEKFFDEHGLEDDHKTVAMNIIIQLMNPNDDVKNMGILTNATAYFRRAKESFNFSTLDKKVLENFKNAVEFRINISGEEWIQRLGEFFIQMNKFSIYDMRQDYLNGIEKILRRIQEI